MVPSLTGQERPESVRVAERRADVLDVLADGPLDQRDLRDVLDVSRSTAYKALRELVDAELVGENPDGTYGLTQYGRMVRRRHDAYVASVRRLDEAQPVLSALPDDVFVPLAFVERGHAFCADRHAPERPFAEMESLSYATHEYRCLSPIAVPRYMAPIHERVEAGELTAELLVQSPAVEHLREYDRFDALLAEPGFTLLVTERELRYGLLVAADVETAGLFAYGPDGSVRGMLRSDVSEAYAWADRQYERFRADATEVAV